MARKLKAENHADVKATFAEIEVLGNIGGSTIRTIRANVNSLQQSVATQAAKTENYWRDIASDNIVTAIEKKTLKKEFQTITQTYTSLLVMAEQVEVMETQEIKDYMKAYKDLYDYLYITLRLFDNMAENTTIPNATEFNSRYDELYDNQTKAQNRVVVMQPISIRKLETLDTPGLDGEIALYKGNFYIYTNNAWNPINKDEYRGVMLQGEQVPDPIPGTYFLNVSGNAPRLLDVGNGKYLAVNVSTARIATAVKPFKVNAGLKPGMIYLCSEEGEWTELQDKNDWHYVIAMNDLLRYNFQLSPKLQEWLNVKLDALQQWVNGGLDDLKEEFGEDFGILEAWVIENFQDLEDIFDGDIAAFKKWIVDNIDILLKDNTDLKAALDEVKKNLGRKTPKYLGAYNQTKGFPQEKDYISGDWFTWTGPADSTTWKYSQSQAAITLKRGQVYKYNMPTWTELNPQDNINNGDFMAALADIVDCMKADETGTGYFVTLFAKKFFALEAVIQSLQTQVITLTGEKAKIVSEAKNQYNEPLIYIDAQGNIRLKGAVEIGDDTKGVKLTSDGAVIKGTIQSVNCNISGNSFFGGEIESGPLRLKSTGGMDLQIFVPSGTSIAETINIIEDNYKAYTGANIYGDSYITVYKGSYGNKELTSFKYEYDGSYSYLWLRGPDLSLRLYGRTDGSISQNLSFNFFTGNEKEFSLIDLPVTNPGQKGRVWNDKGTLKIVT